MADNTPRGILAARVPTLLSDKDSVSRGIAYVGISFLDESLIAQVLKLPDSEQRALFEGIVTAALARLKAEPDTTRIEITPSEADITTLNKMIARSSKSLVRGLPFPITPVPLPALEDFTWPEVQCPESGQMQENEEAGYDAALQWIQQHVCPEGVRAVLKAGFAWLDSWPLPNVWIYSGSVDVVFVLEEYADEAAERDPFCCLELICGQCELKTEQHFEANKDACFAQAAVQHTAATYLQNRQLTYLAKEYGVQLMCEPKFVTILSDLCYNWTELIDLSDSLVSLEATPALQPTNSAQNIGHDSGQDLGQLEATSHNSIRAASVLYLKQALKDSADKMRAIYKQLHPDPIAKTYELQPTAEGRVSGDTAIGNTDDGCIPRSSSSAAQPLAAQPAIDNSEVDDRSKPQKPTAEQDAPQRLTPYQEERIREAGKQFSKRLRNDKDFQRQVEAAWSAQVTGFLQTPTGYRDLLGLEGPPKTVKHPTFMEWLSTPKSQHVEMLQDAINEAQEGNACGASSKTETEDV